jgi:phenylalanyl-tRNA synthetase beta chain
LKVLVSWLRDFVEVPIPPRELADRFVMLGLEVASVDEVANAPVPPFTDASGAPDAVIDLEVTANRPDCFGLVGVAREVSAALGLPLRLPGAPGAGPLLAAADLTTGDDATLKVTLEDEDLCPRYSAAVADITTGPSPAWLARRLELCDIRPLGNIVDVTNYVLMEMGQPMHAFDLARIAGPELRIRRALSGESITTLDGQRRALDREMLVIADAERAQAIAGVMGGQASEVGQSTRAIALESATFDPRSVRRTSKKLGLKTEASTRFERGADVSATVLGLRRAAALLKLIGAGTARGLAVDRYPAPQAPRRIHLRRERVTCLLGTQVPDQELETKLPALGFSVAPAEGGWEITVPTARVDVTREADLIEEVGRHHGFDRLAPTFPALDRPPSPPDVRIARDQLVRRVLTAAGFSEAITFAFIEQAAADAFSAEDERPDLVPIDNPLSAKFAVLRRSLIPGLVESVVHNRNHERRDVRLFEVGHCFSRTSGEVRKVALAWTGTASPPHWSGSGRDVDFFDARGVVERLMEALGVAAEFLPAVRSYLTRGQAAAVRAALPRGAKVEVGVLGRLASAVGADRGLARADVVFVAELDLDALWFGARAAAAERTSEALAPLPRYPSIVRDVSILLADTLPAEKVRGTIRATAPDTLESVREFDRYTGKGVPDGQVSVSYRLTFRAPDRTLTDPEVQRAMDAVLAALAGQHGAVQR